MVNKRGISPLIATVLIIGFTIVVAALVVQWGGSLFKGVQERTSTSSEIEEKCSTQLSHLEIESVEYDSLTQFIKVKIDNANEIPIESLFFRVYQDDGSIITAGWSEKIKQGELKITTILADGMFPKKVGIFPSVFVESKQEIIQCTQEWGPYSIKNGPTEPVPENNPNEVIDENRENQNNVIQNPLNQNIENDAQENNNINQNTGICAQQTDCPQEKFCYQQQCLSLSEVFILKKKQQQVCVEDSDCSAEQECLNSVCTMVGQVGIA